MRTVTDWQFKIICIRIVPLSGSSVFLTTASHDLTIGGNVYLSNSGYEFSGYSANSSFSPSSVDIEGILEVTGLSRAAVASGFFDGARCYVFATSWRAPIEDEEPITVEIFGKTILLDNRFKVEGVSLIDALNQSVGEIYSASCPKTFCGQEYGGCMASLAANTVTGTLTSVTSASVFASSARTEPDDTFGAGTIQFTSGPNAGLKALEIKSFAGGVITTFEPFYYLPVVGNSYTMVRGCRKRLSDCQSRVGGSNVVNFGGFPWVPTSSTYAKVGQGGA